jgi:hypothetical protein
MSSNGENFISTLRQNLAQNINEIFTSIVINKWVKSLKKYDNY